MDGLVAALASALLFALAVPASKVLLADATPLQLAGLLYLGGALGIAPRALHGRTRRPRLDAPTRRRLAGAVVLGGVAGPALLLFALRSTPAGSVALLLNLEIVATALLGALVFGETLGARGWCGVVVAAAAGIVLSAGSGWPGYLSAVLVAAACLCWGIDNNLTAGIGGMSPSETTLWKTGLAGTTNLVLGIMLAPWRLQAGTVVTALGVGALSYGASIALAIRAAQAEGAIRTQSVFASAPFIAALLSWIGLHEPVQGVQLVAGALFLTAIVLLAVDDHAHAHVHEAVAHVHSHRHDDGHHAHAHPGLLATARHTHWHEHAATEHTHRHVADLHHRHGSRQR
ncbi:MAG TPA: DMT family transporter [Candidatus Binatia bacterium]|nr:DMT family transporter [Candidatus Binatia bacterium]